MKRLELVELLLLAALWGGSFLFMRMAAPALGPIWLIALRVGLAGFVFLPALVRLGWWHHLHQHLKPLLIVGCLNSAIPFSLLAFASLSLPAGFTSILNATAPLFGTIVASVWLRETLSTARMVGFGLGFVGVVVLVGWRELSNTPSFWVAVLAGLAAAFMYAIAAPYIKRHLAQVPSLVITTGSQLGAAVVLLPLLPFTVPQQPPSGEVMVAVLALALLSTALAYVLYFHLIQTVGSTKALTVTYLIPLFAMVWGAIVLQETITPSMLLGCGLVLLGTAIANEVIKVPR